MAAVGGDGCKRVIARRFWNFGLGAIAFAQLNGRCAV